MSLPENVVSMLRGEIGYSAEVEDLAEVSRMYYQDGKTGQPYDFPPMPPEFTTDAVEFMKNFLRKCWEQGRQDAREAQP